MNQPAGSRWMHLSLTAIATLLAVIATQLFVLIGPLDRPAVAQSTDMRQFANRTAQRLDLLDEQRRTNQLLEQILDHLKNQSVKVKLAGTDKDDGEADDARRPGDRDRRR